MHDLQSVAAFMVSLPNAVNLPMRHVWCTYVLLMRFDFLARLRQWLYLFSWLIWEQKMLKFLSRHQCLKWMFLQFRRKLLTGSFCFFQFRWFSVETKNKKEIILSSVAVSLRAEIVIHYSGLRQQKSLRATRKERHRVPVRNEIRTVHSQPSISTEGRCKCSTYLHI